MASDERLRLMQFLRLEGHTMARAGGDRHFFLKRVDGVPQAFAGSTRDRWPHQLTFFDGGVAGFEPSPDGRLLAVLPDEGGSEQTSIVLVDTATGATRSAVPTPDRQAGLVRWRPDSAAFLFRANLANGRDFEIYEYDVALDETRLVASPGGWASPVAYEAAGAVLFSVATAKRNQDVYVRRADGTTSHLTPHDGDVRYELQPSPTGFYALTDEGDDMSRLQVWSSDGRDRRPLGPPVAGDLSDLRVSPSGRYVLALANVEGYGAIHLVDALTGAALPVPSTRGVVVDPCFLSDDEILFAYEFPARPSQLYRWNWRHETLEQLTWTAFQGLDRSAMVEPELIRVTSFDGLEIPAFLYLPRGRGRGEAGPMVVYFHGGPEGQLRPGFHRQFQYLLDRGLAVCAPNVRGSSGYGARYMALDDYRLRPDAVRDGVEVARAMVTRGLTTPDGLAAAGGSYGGYMVLSVITEAPELFAAAVDRVGIANLETFLEGTSSYRRAIREAEYGPLSDREFLRSISPIHRMDRVRTPLLVVHGENDPRVPVGEARQVAAALDARGVPVDLLVFPDEGHGITRLANEAAYVERMGAFLSRHLAGAS